MTEDEESGQEDNSDGFRYVVGCDVEYCIPGSRGAGRTNFELEVDKLADVHDEIASENVHSYLSGYEQSIVLSGYPDEDEDEKTEREKERKKMRKITPR
jgi:hypothetical protein